MDRLWTASKLSFSEVGPRRGGGVAEGTWITTFAVSRQGLGTDALRGSSLRQFTLQPEAQIRYDILVDMGNGSPPTVGCRKTSGLVASMSPHVFQRLHGKVDGEYPAIVPITQSLALDGLAVRGLPKSAT